jgi:calcium-independent phospholipase A2-gamma
MLGRMRMSVDECIAEYEQLGPKVFSEKKLVGEELFKSSNLERAMKDVIRRRLGHNLEDAPLMDPLGDECCKTIVFALPAANPNVIQAQAFRSYVSDFEKAIPCTIWQAARAASAAPTFFKPMRLGSPAKDWIDAGMKFNNPGNLILSEVGEIWGDGRARLELDRHVGCFLSLGTGLQDVIRLSTPDEIEKALAKVGIPIKAIKVMKAIITDTETVADQLANSPLEDVYFRFNVEQGLQAVQLFDYEKSEDMSVDTENYLKKMRNPINKCATQMATIAPRRLPMDPPRQAQFVIDYPDMDQQAMVDQQLEELKMYVRRDRSFVY